VWFRVGPELLALAMVLCLWCQLLESIASFFSPKKAIEMSICAAETGWLVNLGPAPASRGTCY
jgi:hypothetical protein